MRMILLLLALAASDRALAQSGGHEDAYSRARACAVGGDHACVIQALDGHCESAREYELLISSLRRTGAPDVQIIALMREYLERYPSGRQSPAYRDYIAAHS